MYLQNNICQKQIVSLSNYLGNCELDNIKKVYLLQELSKALICKCSLRFSKGACHSAFQTYFTMEILIYIFICLFLFVVEHFRGLFYITRFGKH